MSNHNEQARAEALAAKANIAVITALSKEQAAMKAMLDNPVSLSTPGKAPGEYIMGTIPSKNGSHHIVVLVRTSMGENLASAHTSILLERFPGIEHVVMVGIAGAVPNPQSYEDDVRLGDIVVSGSDGVIQYDHDKEIGRRGKVTTIPRHPPRPPSARLLTAAQDLQTLELEGVRPWQSFLHRGQPLTWTKRPDDEDILYQATDPNQPVLRPTRALEDTTRVFHGKIGSANKLLKNPKLRERLRKTFSIKAVEMEASGVADASWLQQIGYFVVRGTCDYCDTHKNDAWHGYAALVAAAYTRALLEQTRADIPIGTVEIAGSDGSAPYLDIEDLPRGLREKIVRLSEQGGNSNLSLSLVELLSFDDRIESVFDGGWPFRETWTLLAIKALNETYNTYGISLSDEEAFLAVALMPFISAVRKTWIRSQFESQENVKEQWFQELFVVNPALKFFNKDLPSAAYEILRRSAVLRVASNHRPTWPDSIFQEFCPDTRLSQAFVSEPLILSLIRITGGNVEDFQTLPEKGRFRFGEYLFTIRWKHLACILTLSELRILGLHLLPHDVLENAAQLPDVAFALEKQFRDDVSVVTDRHGDWVLQATCDEPVIDYALHQIVDSLNKELLEQRILLSQYLMQTTQRSFPRILAEIHPRLYNGRPRYTTPHVTFALSTEHAKRIFMGSDLWGDKTLAYRELFQNALDACRYRAARCKILGIPYFPSIKIYHGRTENGEEFVECEDNGIGMTRDLISSCFAIAGRRFVETEEFRRERELWRNEGIEVHTNSQFGIGVFSYFLIADELELETARLGLNGETPKDRLLLRVPTASSFFRIISITPAEARERMLIRARERNDEPRGLDAGTRVRLRLRPYTATKDIRTAPKTCVDTLRENVWFSEVRVEVRDYRGEQLIIEPNSLAPWLTGAIRSNAGEPTLWWFPKGEHPSMYMIGEPAVTFRSRTPNKDNKPYNYNSFGCVLVDGIATTVKTPGFIVNLRGSYTPSLSLDRRKIRSDIHEVLQQVVEAGLPILPDEVSELFLRDLWYWDPRACHRVQAGIKRTWTRYEPKHTESIEVEPAIVSTRTYLPPLPDKSIYLDKASDVVVKVFIELWKLANDMPDARHQNRLVLEARGLYLLDIYKRNIKCIPKIIWDAMQSVALGVPEAAALYYGTNAEPRVIAVYMSWLSGEPLSFCHSRLRNLSDFLGLEMSVPESDSAIIISDYDAWLLGVGNPAPPWVGPLICTFDVVRFCRATDRSATSVLSDFRELTAKLGWTMEFDATLAEIGMHLTNEEFLNANIMKRGYTVSSEMPLDRLEQIVKLTGVELPPIILSNIITANITEEEKAIIEEVRRVSRRGELTLSDACSIARSLKKPIKDALSLLVEVAQKVGVTYAWTFEEQIAVGCLSEKDWELVEDNKSSYISYKKKIKPRNMRSLAALLQSKSYRYYGSAGYEEIKIRLTMLYDLFRWGPVPLNSEQIIAASALTYPQVTLLDLAPASGKYSIPLIIGHRSRSGQIGDKWPEQT